MHIKNWIKSKADIFPKFRLPQSLYIGLFKVISHRIFSYLKSGDTPVPPIMEQKKSEMIIRPINLVCLSK